jgi:hypothetical protein
MRAQMAGWQVLVLALLLGGCAAPIPSHLTRLWPLGHGGEPVLGLSTEEGVIILTAPHFYVGEMFNIQFPFNDDGVVDLGTIDHLNDDLAVVRPRSSRLVEGRLATALPTPQETLYLAQRDERDKPIMTPVDAYKDGRYGNYITVPGVDEPGAFARDQAGAGLYVMRDERWQIAGILAGITLKEPGDDPDDAGLGYIGLVEIVRVLPDRIDFFERDIQQLRPDFEFGVPLQPGDIEVLGVAGSGDEAADGP